MVKTCSSKRPAIGGNKLDRLTDLPTNIIHHIQDHMSIDDAVKMCVLSKRWSHIWATNPKLVFDKQFCTKRKESGTASTIISIILMQHRGAIKMFLLDMSILQSSQHSFVDQWMRYLSGNGLVNLALRDESYGNAPYKLPSYVYSVKLERLELSNCIFRPPCTFRGFHGLKWLSLNQVTFEIDAATSSLLMPNLERLYMERCIGVRFLNIYAPKLFYLYFCVCGKDTLNLDPFMECGKLQVVGFQSQEVSQNKQDKAMKLTDLPHIWPSVRRLLLNCCFLKFLASGIEEGRLSTCFTNLEVLAVVSPFYYFESEDQVLLLLRSCPHLKELQFFLLSNKDDMEVEANFSEGPDYTTQGLNNLQTLQINRFHGSTKELRFVKFILSSAPLLSEVILLVDTAISDSQSLEILKKVSRFPRASPKSEIVYEPASKEPLELLSVNFGVDVSL